VIPLLGYIVSQFCTKLIGSCGNELPILAPSVSETTGVYSFHGNFAAIIADSLPLLHQSFVQKRVFTPIW
jgi:hypothetical protein